MALRSPELKAAPHLLCDWVELKALSTPLGQFRLSSLRRLWDVNRETEASDPEGKDVREEDTDQYGVSGVDDEVFIDSISDEIADRASALGASYPFEIDDSNCVKVNSPPTHGGFMYVFCLLLTHSNGKSLFDGTWLPQVDHKVRDLFQACSTVAAAGEVQGCAVSFGWPRPNNSLPFLAKLRQVYAEFGEGIVVDVRLPGTSPFSKDEEIDVIAWRPRPDRAPGTQYLLGQVASGDNWMSKSILGPPIDSFHRNWFHPPPPSQAQATIFIPHAVAPVDGESTRRDRLDILTSRFGIVIDRFRLPLLVTKGMDLARDTGGSLLIERIDDMDTIGWWVVQQINSLHVAAS